MYSSRGTSTRRAAGRLLVLMAVLPAALHEARAEVSRGEGPATDAHLPRHQGALGPILTRSTHGDNRRAVAHVGPASGTTRTCLLDGADGLTGDQAAAQFGLGPCCPRPGSCLSNLRTIRADSRHPAHRRPSPSNQDALGGAKRVFHNESSTCGCGAESRHVTRCATRRAAARATR